MLGMGLYIRQQMPLLLELFSKRPLMSQHYHSTAGDATESSVVAPAGLVSFISRSGLRLPLRFTDCLFGVLCRLALLLLFGEPERDCGDLDLNRDLSFASCPGSSASSTPSPLAPCLANSLVVPPAATNSN